MNNTPIETFNIRDMIALANYVIINTHIDIIRTQGTFVSGNVRGNTSSANWIINTISDTATMNTAFEDIVDNARIEAEADGIMDWTETNPFGTD